MYQQAQPLDEEKIPFVPSHGKLHQCHLMDK